MKFGGLLKKVNIMFELFVGIGFSILVAALGIGVLAAIDHDVFPVYTQIKNRLDPIRAAGIALEIEDLINSRMKGYDCTYCQRKGLIVLGDFRFFSFRVYLQARALRKDYEKLKKVRAIESRRKEMIVAIENKRKYLT